jgi:hypothetical protein
LDDRGDIVTTLSIDPGGTIGWALFDDRGGEIGRGKMDFETFSHSIHYKPQLSYDQIQFMPRGIARATAGLMIDEVVYESFYQDPGIKQGGSTGPAQEVIGVVKYLCLQAGIHPTAQRSALLPVAMKHHGYEPPVTKTGNPKHLPDEDSAWLHGMYYLTFMGKIKPRDATL